MRFSQWHLPHLNLLIHSSNFLFFSIPFRLFPLVEHPCYLLVPNSRFLLILTSPSLSSALLSHSPTFSTRHDLLSACSNWTTSTPHQLCFRAFLRSTFSSSQPTRDFPYRQALTQSSRQLGFRKKVGFRSIRLCDLPIPRFSLEVPVTLLPGRRRSLPFISTPDCSPLETAVEPRSIPSEVLLAGLSSRGRDLSCFRTPAHCSL